MRRIAYVALLVLVASVATGQVAWDVQASQDGQSVLLKPQACGPYWITRVSTGGGNYQLILAINSDAGKPPVVWPVPFSIGGPTPAPVPPAPPTPIPLPPNPTPEPVPFTGPIHVMVVEVTADRGKLPKEQSAIFTSQDVRKYLNGHCAKDASGKPAYRFLDEADDLSGETADWQDVFKRAAGKPRPWLVIANQQNSFEGPLPGSIKDTIALFAKYGGN